MAEIRRGGDIGGGGNRPAFGDRLPWLEPVEDQDVDDYQVADGGYGGVVLVGIVVLILIALVTAGVLWYRHHAAATADIGQIIHADPGPYKVKPQDPGGMKPDMTERVAAGTGAGQDIDAPLDAAAMPEAPIVGPRGRAQATAPAAAPAPAPAAQAAASAPAARVAPPPAAVAAPAVAPVVPPKPVVKAAPEAPAPAGGAIQLGAFSSEAKAKAAWKALSGRFDYLKDMTPIVGAVTTGSGTLYRLRASGGTGGAPASLCGRLKLAGESCAVIGG